MMPKALTEFVRETKKEKTRSTCAICKLKPGLRAQIDVARQQHGIKAPMIVAWLQNEHDTSVQVRDVIRHTQGRHDHA